jgi:hypothetical protein
MDPAKAPGPERSPLSRLRESDAVEWVRQRSWDGKDSPLPLAGEGPGVREMIDGA